MPKGRKVKEIEVYIMMKGEKNTIKNMKGYGLMMGMFRTVFYRVPSIYSLIRFLL